MLRGTMITLLVGAATMALMCTGCGGGSGGSLGGNNVSKSIAVNLGEFSVEGPQAEIPVDVNGDGVVDGVIKGGIIIWIADHIVQSDSGLLAGATLAPAQLATTSPSVQQAEPTVSLDKVPDDRQEIESQQEAETQPEIVEQEPALSTDTIADDEREIEDQQQAQSAQEIVRQE